LSAAQSRLEEAQNSFPDILNTTGIINAILRLADEVGVKAIPLVTQPWAVENISDQDYSVFRLSVTATGTFTKLSGFIHRLETDEPATLVIESLLTDRAPETDEELVAELEIVVYARPYSPTRRKRLPNHVRHPDANQPQYQDSFRKGERRRKMGQPGPSGGMVRDGLILQPRAVGEAIASLFKSTKNI